MTTAPEAGKVQLERPYCADLVRYSPSLGHCCTYGKYTTEELCHGCGAYEAPLEDLGDDDKAGEIQ